MAFDDLTNPTGPHRLDEIQNFAAWDPVAGQLILLEANLQCGLSCNLLTRDVGCSFDGQENLLELVAQTPQLVEVVTYDLDPYIGADPGDHLVDAHLDWLGEYHIEGRQIVQHLLHDAHELWLGSCTGPCMPWMQRDEDVRQLDSHRIGRHLCRSDPTPDVAYLVRKLIQQDLFDSTVVGGGFIDRDPREANCVDDNRSFSELRDELSTQPGRDESRHGEQNSQEPIEPALPAQGHRQHRLVCPMERP